MSGESYCPECNAVFTGLPHNCTKAKQGLTSDGVTEAGLTEYPSILKALVDPDKRVKLEKIYQSLKDFKQTENVYYGCRDPIPFDVVGDLLEVTK